MSEYEDIRDSEVVEQLFKDEAWERTLARRKARYADEFAAAPGEEAALRVWRKFQVLADVVNELVVTKNTGEVAKIKKSAREKQGKKS